MRNTMESLTSERVGDASELEECNREKHIQCGEHDTFESRRVYDVGQIGVRGCSLRVRGETFGV